MIALLSPLGLLGVTSGISLGCIGTSLFAMTKVRKLNRISIRELLREILPPLGAALLMAAIMVPVEFLLVEAASKGTLAGLGLLAAEGVVGLALYLAFMLVVSPHTITEMRGLFVKMTAADSPPADGGAVTPTYSVVVTASNEEDCIGGAVASVLAQTRGDLELIVVDDGSTDGTVEAVQPFEADPRLRLIRQPNIGLSAARNTGIEAGETEPVAPRRRRPLDAGLSRAGSRRPRVPPGRRLRLHRCLVAGRRSGRFYRASARSRRRPASPRRTPTTCAC